MGDGVNKDIAFAILLNNRDSYFGRVHIGTWGTSAFPKCALKVKPEKEFNVACNMFDASICALCGNLLDSRTDGNFPVSTHKVPLLVLSQNSTLISSYNRCQMFSSQRRFDESVSRNGCGTLSV